MKPKFQMIAKMHINGGDEAHAVYTGGFAFVVDGKEILFDWDASGTHKQEDGTWLYESGYGAFFNDFELSDCYDAQLKKQNIDPRAINAYLLHKVSEITEFFVEVLDKDGNELSVTIDLLEVYFVDRTSDKRFDVRKEVLDRYNQMNKYARMM